MGGLSLAVGAVWRDGTGSLVGVALMTLGAVELHGRVLLQRGNTRSTGWLVASQLGLLAVIFAYCLRNLQHPASLPAGLLAELDNLPGFGAADINLETMLPALSKIVYSALMLVSVFYQGGMAFHYLRKVPRALQEPPQLPLV